AGGFVATLARDRPPACPTAQAGGRRGRGARGGGAREESEAQAGREAGGAARRSAQGLGPQGREASRAPDREEDREEGLALSPFGRPGSVSRRLEWQRPGSPLRPPRALKHSRAPSAEEPRR